MKKSLVILLIAAAVVVAGGSLLLRQSSNNKSSPRLEKPAAEKTLPAGQSVSSTPGQAGYPASSSAQQINDPDWTTWRNDVLGIKFSYPKKWGEPVTDPLENITDLGAIAQDTTGKVVFDNSITISFGNGDSHVSVSLFNDVYPGEVAPGQQYLTDNFRQLRQSGNICNYKVEYNPDHLYWDTAPHEVYSECHGGDKTTLLRNYNTQNHYYNYGLWNSAYKKLQNGYFDNLLAEYWLGDTPNISKDTLTLDDFFIYKLTEGSSTLAEYEKNKADFEKFISSIQVYQPVKKPRAQFKDIKNEDPNITAIRKYYYNIYIGDLPAAYAMYQKQPVKYATYAEWYATTVVANPYDIKKIGPDTYQFMVDFQDRNQKPTVYRTTMKVSNGKLTTISAEEITSQQVKSGGLSAFTKAFRGYNYVILSKNNQEFTVEKAPNDYINSVGDALFFDGLEFSPLGHYLAYSASGWEWYSAHVYDINAGELQTFDAAAAYGFSKDEKMFYACADDDEGGVYYVDVYSLPNFKLKENLLDLAGAGKSMIGLQCDYDAANNRLTAKISCVANADATPCNWVKTVEYDFNTDKATIVK